MVYNSFGNSPFGNLKFCTFLDVLNGQILQIFSSSSKILWGSNQIDTDSTIVVTMHILHKFVDVKKKTKNDILMTHHSQTCHRIPLAFVSNV